jgi:hypothetical protein
MNKLFLFSSIAVLFWNSALAMEMKGIATIPYSGGFMSSEPTDDEKAKAIHSAKVNAINKYASTLSISQQKLLGGIQSEIATNPDRFLTEHRVVSQEINKQTKTYSVVVRTNINEGLLANEMSRNMPVNTGASGEGSSIVSLFVARQVTESRIFDERRAVVSQSKAGLDAGASGTKEYSQQSSYRANGGNRVRKAAKHTYTQLASTDFDAAFNNIMTSNGYESIDFSDVTSECGGPRITDIKKAFMASDELPQNLRKNAIFAAKKCDIQFFSLGTLNVTAPMTDPVTGNQRVVVSVDGMIWNITKRLPRKVGSVGPIQITGLGMDDESARREALKLAAEKAAAIIASQLGSKNIR